MKFSRSLLAAAGIAASCAASLPAHAINIDNTFAGGWTEIAPNPVTTRRGLDLQYIKIGPELGNILVVGFTYDNEGNQLWFTGNDGQVRPGDTTLDFNISRITGGLPVGSMDAGSPAAENIGTLSLEVFDCNNITATLASSVLGNSTFDLDRGAALGLVAGPESCAYQQPFQGCPDFSIDASSVIGIDRSCALTGTYTDDITLTNDITWVLNGPVFIGDRESNANTNTLTIEPGTRIVGSGFVQREALIIARGARINAEGTELAPIVFSSSRPTTVPGNPASAAQPGDWGGLVINGLAPVNDCPAGDCPGEGNSGNFGGDNPDDSSGVLRYVRIQFAGDSQTPENQLNGLACQGCGAGTVIDHIQVHANLDDGIEFFGGTANASHVVLTDIGDDSLDWTFGWQGNVQYVVVRQDQDPNASVVDRGFEADNNGGEGGANDLEPRSQPAIANVTILGNPNEIGILLREGTGANLTNIIVTGSATCIDIDNSSTFTAAGTPENLTGTLTLENAIVSCEENFDEEAEDGFAVSAWFNAQNGNQVLDPALNNIYPPMGASYLSGQIIDPAKFGAFFDKVEFSGAFPSEGSAWTHGWTEFLDN